MKVFGEFSQTFLHLEILEHWLSFDGINVLYLAKTKQKVDAFTRVRTSNKTKRRKPGCSMQEVVGRTVQRARFTHQHIYTPGQSANLLAKLPDFLGNNLINKLYILHTQMIMLSNQLYRFDVHSCIEVILDNLRSHRFFEGV